MNQHLQIPLWETNDVHNNQIWRSNHIFSYSEIFLTWFGWLKNTEMLSSLIPMCLSHIQSVQTARLPHFMLRLYDQINGFNEAIKNT